MAFWQDDNHRKIEENCVDNGEGYVKSGNLPLPAMFVKRKDGD
jgi:hypothetical protein